MFEPNVNEIICVVGIVKLTNEACVEHNGSIWVKQDFNTCMVSYKKKMYIIEAFDKKKTIVCYCATNYETTYIF